MVVDASALVEWLLPGPRHVEASTLLEDPDLVLLAPDLIMAETANAFRKAWRDEVLSAESLSLALEDLYEVELTTVAVRPLLPTLAPLLPQLTAYDACYLALALQQGAPLATFDRELAHAAAEHDVQLPLANPAG